MSRRHALLGVALVLAGTLDAQENYKRTGSRRPYTHVIELRAADGTPIDPRAAAPPPYSPRATCQPCHDVEAIEAGHHFNAARSPELAGRPGEPWWLVDPRTATQLPLSWRPWDGTFRPPEVGLDPQAFLRAFGRHLAGGGSGYAGHAVDAGRARWSGALEVDCLICHDASRTYSHERWMKQVEEENFAWAPTDAAGLGKVEGSVDRVRDDADPAQVQLPKVDYDLRRFDLEGKVFFDVVRDPGDGVCWACHTVAPAAPSAARWTEDVDVHLRAGMTCVDCHRNGIEHHTVRGYEGETHPSGRDVRSASCRGCHLGAPEEGGGRLGAPRPEHAGLPPLHLEVLACTACHSGPQPRMRPRDVQTSMAHALGRASQERGETDLPRIVEPVFVRGRDGVVRPERMAWPSFWGFLGADDRVSPLAPAEAFQRLRRPLRVRKDLLAEASRASLSRADLELVLGAERADAPEAERTAEERARLARRLRTLELEALRAKLAQGLSALVGQRGDAVPVFVAEGLLHRLGPDGATLVSMPHPDARPVSWPLAHDVRPARLSLGAGGCQECHAEDAAFAHAAVEAPGPFDEESVPMHVFLDWSPDLMTSWEASFEGRTWFKVVGVAALALTGAVLLLHLFVGLSAVSKLFLPRRRP